MYVVNNAVFIFVV